MESFKIVQHNNEYRFLAMYGVGH